VRGALVDSPIVRLLLDVSAVPARPAGAGVYTVELAGGRNRHDEARSAPLARRDGAARWADLVPKAAIHPEVPEPPGSDRVGADEGSGLAARLAIQVWHGPHTRCRCALRVPAVVTVHDLTFFDHLNGTSAAGSPSSARCCGVGEARPRGRSE
jgi:hypothetical protein